MKSLTAIVAALVLAACSGSSSVDADASLPLSDAGGSMFEPPPSVVSVASFPASSSISLTGSFNDGPAIELRGEMARVGACRLMSYSPSFCDPACGASELCVEGACQAFPSRQNQGPIEWTWPGGQTTVMPDGTNFYNASGSVSSHGETSITVSGNTLMVETNPEPIPDGDWSQQVSSRSGDVTLRWGNPVSGARVRLAMTDCVGSHGGIGALELECDAPDSGELTLPEAFLSALDDGDWSRGECGSHSVSRYTVDDTQSGVRLEAVANSGFFYRPE